MKTVTLATAMAIAALCSAPGLAQTAAPAKTAQTSKGPALVDGKGMTLYVSDRDTTPGKSACNGPCATNWPPLMAASGSASGDWTIITRDDGGKQWAYKAKPLYTWKNDAKPGDVTGDGVQNVWHVAKP